MKNKTIRPQVGSAHTTASVRWIDQDGREHESLATPELLDQELYLAKVIRTGNRYPKQRNYHGWYLFGQTKQHVWVESRLEASRLAHLDHMDEIVAITSQPMEITFADGSRHVPDFMTLGANHRQTVYDVKPMARMTVEVTEQFRKTKAVCRAVGWGYRVMHEANPVAGRNLNFLSMFKHPAYRAPEHAIDRARAAAPGSFKAVATAMQPTDPALGRSQLLHLLWIRSLDTDLNLRLNDNSTITRSAS